MKTLGFLGVAHIHTPGFVKRLNERRDEFRVKAVWDNQPARARIAADHLSGATVMELDAIVGDDEIDAVVVCSETALHRELVEAAAAAGKDMFVEKPLGITASDAYAMSKAIDEAGLIFQIGHFMRGFPALRVIKRWIDDGALGTITRIRHSNVHQGALAGIFDAGKGWYDDGWLWMTDMERSGMGGFGDLGAHSLDVLMWLLGDVLSVTAQMDSLLGKYPCDEYGEGMLRFANGAIGTLAAGWVDLARAMPIYVSGTEGVAYVDDDKLLVKSDNLTGAELREWTDLPEALPHAFDLFLNALNGAEVPLISAREAADRTTVMEAFYQAAESNTWVQPHKA